MILLNLFTVARSWLQTVRRFSQPRISRPEQILPETQVFSIIDTVCPGSSDPPEKMFNIFESKNEVCTIY